MKTTHKLKCLAAASSFALLASTYPAFSQNTVNNNPSQPAGAEMRQPTMDEGAVINEPAGADNARNWSWIGLLGLAGLFGLKRHHDVKDEHYRTARA